MEPEQDEMLAELMALPTDMAFGDLERILVDLGWEVRDTGKSHVIVQRLRGAPLTIVRKPRHRVTQVVSAAHSQGNRGERRLICSPVSSEGTTMMTATATGRMQVRGETMRRAFAEEKPH